MNGLRFWFNRIGLKHPRGQMLQTKQLNFSYTQIILKANTSLLTIQNKVFRNNCTQPPTAVFYFDLAAGIGITGF
jgi:hypothetical protein